MDSTSDHHPRSCMVTSGVGATPIAATVRSTIVFRMFSWMVRICGSAPNPPWKNAW
ncbi:hypothetical protein YT1_5397 [Rhodococcus ruber]|nr:hypothetical protein YT1_5397 [Rhodococcus ruber]